MRIMRSIVVSALASVAFLLASRADAQSDRVIDPKAQAIVERAIDAVRKLDSLELVASNSLEGPAAADRGPAADTPARWTLDFRNAPAGRPFARAVIESLEGDTVTRRVAFDGQKAISVNDAKRTFMVGPFGEVADPSVNMPGWFVDTRLGVSPVGFSPEDMSLPELAAASVVGEETLDGLACDVVRTLRTKSIAGPPGADGTPMPSQEIRIRETIAFARADGLPRRVRLEIELSNAPPDGMASVGVFTGLKPNPPVSDAMFATVAPEGYARAEPPKRMERDAPELKIGVGDPAPAFALVDLDGREVTLASLAGRVVLLDFWATWCGPCKAAMPLIQRIHDDYRDKPVTVLGVNVAERKPDAGRAYMKEKGFTYGCLLAGEELSNAYGIRSIPTLVVIGKDGKVALLEVGLGPDGERTLRAAIDAALAR